LELRFIAINPYVCDFRLKRVKVEDHDAEGKCLKSGPVGLEHGEFPLMKRAKVVNTTHYDGYYPRDF